MILIIDLEHTCMPEAEQPEDYHGQIIEIGAAWVTPAGAVADTFEIFVQAENPVTAFCTELTGITQENVDSGLPYPAAMQALADFAALNPGETWASWGAGDLKCHVRDCAHHSVENPLENWTHRNLKKEWCAANRALLKEKVGDGHKVKQVGMATALAVSSIRLEGPHHRALADVLNIAKLLPGCSAPSADTAEEVEDSPKPESEFQRLLREKKESQKRHIEAIRAMTPEQREIAMKALKKALRGDGVKPLPKMPRPKYNFDF